MPKSNAMPASCAASVVTFGGLPVTPVTILSEGKGSSQGLLIMHGEQVFYIASNALDVKTTIEKVIATITDLNAALTQIATTLTSIGLGMTGPTTAPPPTLAADVLAITGKVTSLTATMAELTALKEVLK